MYTASLKYHVILFHIVDRTKNYVFYYEYNSIFNYIKFFT